MNIVAGCLGASNIRRSHVVECHLWLSLCCSGTSYTLNLISRLSNSQVATNYGHESKVDPRPSFPVYEDQADVGPFWMDLSVNPEYGFPKYVVVVKTHCGGRCESCGPSQYAETTYSFRRACCRGKRRVLLPNKNQTTHVQVHYPTTRVTKAIHLIRDAFDNIVSRFHMETRSGRSASAFNQTKEGFRSYCRGLNQRFSADETTSMLFDEEWLKLTQGVPCRADFFRWIEWHNQVFYMTGDMGLETMILEYGSYSTQFNATCNNLLDFLGLLRHGAPEPFVEGKVYRDYFTKDERKQIGMVLKQMASRKTWQHVAKYFMD